MLDHLLLLLEGGTLLVLKYSQLVQRFYIAAEAQLATGRQEVASGCCEGIVRYGKDVGGVLGRSQCSPALAVFAGTWACAGGLDRPCNEKQTVHTNTGSGSSRQTLQCCFPSLYTQSPSRLAIWLPS